MQERRKRNIAVEYDRRQTQYTYQNNDDDDNSSTFNTIAAVEAIETIADNFSSAPDTSPSTDFGGFDGGSSGGGGASGDFKSTDQNTGQ